MPRWTVVTWNVLGREQSRLAEVARRLADTEADAVALQEIRPGQARRLGQLLGWNVVWRRKHSPYTILMWWRSEGLAVLSPWRLDRPSRTVLTPGVSGRSYRRRIAIAVEVSRGEDRLRVFDTHLSSDDATERVEQARRLAAFVVDDRKAVDAVLCGDLNTQTDEPEVLRELRPTGLVDHGVDPTEPSNAPVRRLDYVLVPGSATDVHLRVPDPGDDWRELSDHLPVVTTFTNG